MVEPIPANTAKRIFDAHLSLYKSYMADQKVMRDFKKDSTAGVDSRKSSVFSFNQEFDRNQDVLIMKKMHETQLEVKNRLIKNLEDIIDEQEARIFNLESHIAGLRELSPVARTPLKGVLRLTDQIDVLTTETVHYKSVAMKKEAELKKEREIVEQYKIKVEELENLLSSKPTHAVTDTEKQLAKLEEDNKNLQEKVGRVSQQLFGLQTSNGDLQKKCENLEKVHNEVVKEGEEKESTLRQKLQESRGENANLVAENASLKSQLGQAQNQSYQEKNVKDKIDSEIKSLEERLEDSEKKNERLKLELEQAEEQNQQTEKKFQDFKNTQGELQKSIEERESSFSAEKEELRKQNEELQQSLQSKTTQADNISLKHKETLKNLKKLCVAFKCLKMEQSEIRDEAFRIQSEYHHHFISLRQKLHRAVSDSMACLVNKYKKEISARKMYYNKLIELKGNIRVLSRVRPMQKNGEESGEKAVEYDEADDGVMHMMNTGGRWQPFSMDKVFRPDSTQCEVFDEVKPIVSSCLDGYNVCIFAYGQTGSGKTYTMEGPNDNPGINQRALLELFEEAQNRRPEWRFTISVTMLEIYNETIRDLLLENGVKNTVQKLEVKMQEGGNGVHVPGIVEMEVRSVEDVQKIVSVGKKNRVTSTTSLNHSSSRSHALLCIKVVGENITAGVRSHGRLNLVDLAGSERVEKSGATGTLLQEAKAINKSLSSLGDVINALKNGRQHIPYRNSKLTYLLQDSLGGDSKTLMIVQVSPESVHMAESISSLSFAQRVRQVELGPPSLKVQNMNSHDTSDTECGNFVRRPSKILRASQRSQKSK